MVERKVKLLHKKRWFVPSLVALTALIAVLVSLFVNALIDNTGKSFSEVQPEDNGAQSLLPADPELSGKIEGRFMFSGTVVTARAVENEARDSSGNVNWASVFSQFSSFEPEKYSEWFIDMECPVTTNSIPYRTQVDNTVFNCPPSVFPEMSKYITMANIANNHTRDQGDDGFAETRQSILDGGLQAVGNWDPRVKEDLCEVMSFTFELTTEGETGAVELPVAVCAYHYFEKDPLPEELDVVSEYAKIMPVIGLMQVGAEYRSNADDKQTEVGRALIDRGADFVVGNSPHWVQNTEVYKGKLIVYSTGNFIFDQLEAETNRGLNLDVQVSTEYNENMDSWIELAKQCKPEVFKDTCFSAVQEKNLTKPVFNYTFDAIASSGGFRQITRRADAVVQAAVLERANWAEVLATLEQAAQ